MFIAYSKTLRRSVYTVSDKHLRHGGSGYETSRRAETEQLIKLLQQQMDEGQKHTEALIAAVMTGGQARDMRVFLVRS